MSNPTDFPEPAAFASGGRVKAVLEPIVEASIIVPESTYFHSVAFPARASWADFLARIVPPFCDPTPTPRGLLTRVRSCSTTASLPCDDTDN